MTCRISGTPGSGSLFSTISLWKTALIWSNQTLLLMYKPTLPHPGLAPYQPQSKYAETLLLYFKMQLQDENYRNRLIKHYAQFKRKIGMKLPKDLEGWVGSMQDCGCGSGLAFKFCCGAK